MEQGDLNDIMNKQKPDDLPDHLGRGLESNLRNWIRDTYSPAFTALTVANSYETQAACTGSCTCPYTISLAQNLSSYTCYMLAAAGRAFVMQVRLQHLSF